jgi:hypothetical protein
MQKKLKIFLITKKGIALNPNLFHHLQKKDYHNNKYNVVVMYFSYPNISVTQFQDVIFWAYSLSKSVLRKRYLSKSTLQKTR